MAKKQKRIELKDVKVGLKVVVREGLDTPIYTISETAREGRAVHLTYELDTPDRKVVSGGWTDYGICLIPTKEQIADDEASRVKKPVPRDPAYDAEAAYLADPANSMSF